VEGGGTTEREEIERSGICDSDVALVPVRKGLLVAVKGGVRRERGTGE
jgi:hypothetical protein